MAEQASLSTFCRHLAAEMIAPLADRNGSTEDGEKRFVLATYRYLRLGMVFVMVAILASVLLTRRTAAGFEQSISAYYYTPTRAVLVSGLVTIGVAMIVIKGWNALEDWLLNLAGLLAPIVAFVPTTPADTGTLTPEARVDVDNNIGALLITGWAILAVATAIASLTREAPGEGRAITQVRVWLSLLFVLAVLTGGTAAFWWTDSIPDYAHGWSAAAMFAALAAAALGNGLLRKQGLRSRYAGWYIVTGASMLAVGLVYLVTSLRDTQWDYEVLHVELLEIGLFVVFWTIQSVERWRWTVDPSTATPPAAEPLDITDAGAGAAPPADGAPAPIAATGTPRPTRS